MNDGNLERLLENLGSYRTINDGALAASLIERNLLAPMSSLHNLDTLRSIDDQTNLIGLSIEQSAVTLSGIIKGIANEMKSASGRLRLVIDMSIQHAKRLDEDNKRNDALAFLANSLALETPENPTLPSSPIPTP